MRLAVAADVHCKLDALRAVIEYLRAQSSDLTVNLGDCPSGPLWPAETADLPIGLGWPTRLKPAPRRVPCRGRPGRG